MTFIKPGGSVILTTQRLRLRSFRFDDWISVHKYASDPVISRFQDWGPNSVSETRQFVRRCIEDTANPSKAVYFFSIARLMDDVHIGGSRLTALEGSPATASIGYTISRDEWNKGYATEMAKAVLEFGFRTLGLHKIIAECDDDNVASWHVMEKIGMQRDRTTKNAKYIKGEWRTWPNTRLIASSDLN